MASRQALSRFATQPLSTLTQRGAATTSSSLSSSSFALRQLARRPSPVSLLLPSSSPSLKTSPQALTFVRLAHNIPRPKAAENASEAAETDTETGTGLAADADKSATGPKVGLAPHYELTFTCRPCGTRSSHNVSKHGYHHGAVLITCPSCRNRHIISDHLGIFGPLTKEGGGRTIEDIMREKGQLVKRGTLGEDGDIEFWEDGTTTERSWRLEAEDVMLPRPRDKKKREGEAGEGGEESAPGSTFQTAKKE